jgi:hypothetical protein
MLNSEPERKTESMEIERIQLYFESESGFSFNSK